MFKWLAKFWSKLFPQETYTKAAIEAENLFEQYRIPGWHRKKLIGKTPAGRRFKELIHEHQRIESQRIGHQISEEEAERLQSELMNVLKGLWLEAHSQAGLVTDLAQLSRQALEKAEEPAQYLDAIKEVRAELANGND